MEKYRYPKKSLNWAITASCNYKCSYCLNSDKKINDDNYPKPYLFLDKFDKYLKGSWIFYYIKSTFCIITS